MPRLPTLRQRVEVAEVVRQVVTLVGTAALQPLAPNVPRHEVRITDKTISLVLTATLTIHQLDRGQVARDKIAHVSVELKGLNEGKTADQAGDTTKAVVNVSLAIAGRNVMVHGGMNVLVGTNLGMATIEAVVGRTEEVAVAVLRQEMTAESIQESTRVDLGASTLVQVAEVAPEPRATVSGYDGDPRRASVDCLRPGWWVDC